MMKTQEGLIEAFCLMAYLQVKTKILEHLIQILTTKYVNYCKKQCPLKSEGCDRFVG